MSRLKKKYKKVKKENRLLYKYKETVEDILSLTLEDCEPDDIDFLVAFYNTVHTLCADCTGVPKSKERPV